jgi:hypothetical protein
VSHETSIECERLLLKTAEREKWQLNLLID